MKFVKKEIVVKGGLLTGAYKVFEELCQNKTPIGVTIKLRKVREVLREHQTVFNDTWNALLGEYIKANEEMKSDHPLYNEWKERATAILNEEVSISLELPTLEEIESWNVSLSAVVLDDLVSLGLISMPETNG